MQTKQNERFFGPSRDEEEEALDGQVARGGAIPEAPALEEIRTHELTHIPYRNCCIQCRRAQARADMHRSETDEQVLEDKERFASTFSVD